MMGIRNTTFEGLSAAVVPTRLHHFRPDSAALQAKNGEFFAVA
jgi:hypothetical protein